VGIDAAQLVITNWAWLCLAWFAGRMQARRRATARELQGIVDAINLEQDLLAQAAIVTERSRIARELQGLVIRGIEEMQRRTRSTRSRLGDSLGEASASIGQVEAIGRRTLVEMRRRLLVLRADHGPVRLMEADSPAASVSSPQRHLLPHWIGIPWVTDSAIIAVMAVLAAAEPLIL